MSVEETEKCGEAVHWLSKPEKGVGRAPGVLVDMATPGGMGLRMVAVWPTGVDMVTLVAVDYPGKEEM